MAGMGQKGIRFSINAVDRSKGAFGGVQQNIRKTQGLQRSWNAGLNANRRAVQQLGFQVGDFATQIAGGQSAMLAFTQQGGQMLQFFGPFGAVAAALLAIFGSMAIAFTKSGKALSDLTPIAGVLRDEFVVLGRILGQVKEIMIDFANIVVNNLDRILITASLVAGFFATKWVIGFVAARLATFTLVGALTALRVAIARTGIGLLIVGAGELVYQFTRLVEGAGGFGEAIKLLGDVAREVWQRITDDIGIIPMAMRAAGLQMAAWFSQQLYDMTLKFQDFTWTIAQGLNDLFGTNLEGARIIEGFGTDAWARSIRDLEYSAADAAAAVKEAWGGPLESVEALLAALRSVDDTQIDVRDWFKGGTGDDEDGDGKGGKDKVAEKIKERIDKIKKMYEDMVSTVKSGLSSMFKSLFDETVTFADAAKSALGSILDKVADMVLDPVWDSLAKVIADTVIGTPTSTGTSLAGGWLSGLLSSFDGGGYTGQGSRSGGLDGKGGRLAMVHPRETIIDHTKSSSSAAPAGGNGTLTISLSDGLRAEMAGEMEGVAIRVVDQKSPGIVSQSVSQTGKVSQSTKKFAGI